jgi:hypothetical protein
MRNSAVKPCSMFRLHNTIWDERRIYRLCEETNREALSDFSIDLAVCDANVNLLSRITSIYSTPEDHGTSWLSRTVLESFKVDQHLVGEVEALNPN